LGGVCSIPFLESVARCCLTRETVCTADEQCCSNNCGSFLGADVCQ
jgi:hypothetical protein